MSGVELLEVRSDSLVGWMSYRRDVAGAGVLALSGSEGGAPIHIARLLAESGFTCLALRYFGGPKLPRNLVEVRLEYIESALEWLRARPEVVGERVGVIGGSKGAELALLSASLFPDAIGAVVAYAPSSVAFAGISLRSAGRRRSSWSHRGQPLPFVPYPRPMRMVPSWRGLSQVSMYERALRQPEAATAAIRIEDSDAAIMLLSGDKDRMWPSSAMAEMLMARLAAAGKADRARHVRFPQAGHSFMPWEPNLRSRLAIRVINGARLAGFGGPFELGGRPSANRQALRQAWDHVVPFLRHHLPSRPDSADRQDA